MSEIKVTILGNFQSKGTYITDFALLITMGLWKETQLCSSTVRR